jgi:hypothetical protein
MKPHTGTVLGCTSGHYPHTGSVLTSGHYLTRGELLIECFRRNVAVSESLMSARLFIAGVAIAILDGIAIWLLVRYVAYRRPQLLKEVWQRIKNLGLNP